MSATLPPGLITIGHAQDTKSGSSHLADVLFERSDVLHSFWKVHAIRHRVSKDALDYRCQNLFWRTWGDPRLSKTITTATLTTLWSLCQQPINKTSLREVLDSPWLNSSGFSPQRSTKLGRALTVSTAQEVAPPSPQYSTTGASSSRRSQNLQKLNTRRTSIDESGELGITIDSGKKSPRTSRPGLARVGSSSNRTSFGAPSNKGKGRPSMNRRKSSQSAAPSKAGKIARPALKSPTFSSRELELADAPAVDRTFELPSASSWEDEPTMDRIRLSSSMSQDTTPSELVDPNFRNRFAERITSSSNLQSMDRMRKSGSVVRFADEMPMNSNITNSIDRSLHPVKEQESLFTSGNGGSSTANVAVIDEDEMPSPGLVRTRSQLSIMIEETRGQQRRERLEPDPVPEYSGLSSRRRKQPTDDEKVLAMAHAEGVTKAGGRQIRKGFKISDGDESRYSSPSPEPIF